mmetsp:Transcript_4904/g.8083  ORF Transcript_4904/g.8083 Transcript_4904/m.8083 type:complete len:200 (+) Transcript_4904:287-886(+)
MLDAMWGRLSITLPRRSPTRRSHRQSRTEMHRMWRSTPTEVVFVDSCSNQAKRGSQMPNELVGSRRPTQILYSYWGWGLLFSTSSWRKLVISMIRMIRKMRMRVHPTTTKRNRMLPSKPLSLPWIEMMVWWVSLPNSTIAQTFYSGQDMTERHSFGDSVPPVLLPWKVMCLFSVGLRRGLLKVMTTTKLKTTKSILMYR